MEINMFSDKVRIFIKSGKGGDGHVSFRHELYVPAGGPDGGNGGHGGDIIFQVDKGLNTLGDFRHNSKYIAQSGEEGGKKRCTGKNGEDLIIKVPEGTVIYDDESGKVIADMSGDNMKETILKGGRGGKGNMNYATATMQAPQYAQPGQEAKELWVRLELKCIADVGLVGFPNVGKSTFLSRVTNARPKIANYHFTTLNPNLGVVGVGDGRSFIMADLPGLIEGASDGAGLGIQFLKHIERTRVIVHIIDMSATDGRVPADDYFKIRKELGQFNQELLKRPEIVVANKMDLPQSAANLAEFKKATGINDVIPISAYTKENVQNLLYKIADTLEEAKKYKPIEDAKDEVVEYNFVPKGPAFTIRKDDSGVYHVEGEEVKKLFDRTNFNVEANVRLFAKKLRDLGVDAELRRLGVESGDTVCVFDYEFEFIE